MIYVNFKLNIYLLNNLKGGIQVISYFNNYKRHLGLLLDQNRVIKFRHAIFQNVKTDDIVIDLGCGIGILGFFALESGASHVYAIEPTEIIELAKKISILNGYSNRITFLKKNGKGISKKDIPEKVDVIISEPISNFLLEGDLWSTIQYLKRFLKEDGKIIPYSGKLFIAPSENAPQTFLDSCNVLNYPNLFHINFDDFTKNVMYKSEVFDVNPKNWVSEPEIILDINLKNDELKDYFSKVIKFKIEKSGLIQGFHIYFKLNIAPKIEISSLDNSHYATWAPQFLPIKLPIQVNGGEILSLKISTKTFPDYHYQWDLELEHFSFYSDLSIDLNRLEGLEINFKPEIIIKNDSIYYLDQDFFVQYDIESEMEKKIIDLIQKENKIKNIIQEIKNTYKTDNLKTEIFLTFTNIIKKLNSLNMIEIKSYSPSFLRNNFSWTIRIP